MHKNALFFNRKMAKITQRWSSAPQTLASSDQIPITSALFSKLLYALYLEQTTKTLSVSFMKLNWITFIYETPCPNSNCYVFLSKSHATISALLNRVVRSLILFTPTPLLYFKTWLLLLVWLLITENYRLLLLFNSCHKSRRVQINIKHYD